MSFRLILAPADTMAIGDGRPFNQADTGRAIAASVFPPPPDTLYGAARVACARALGWDGASDWGDRFIETLGNWSENGAFKISGPFFQAEGSVLLPIPSNVLQKEDSKLIWLQPCDDPIKTDLGDLRLLDIPLHDPTIKYQPLAGRWGRADAVLKLLAGDDVAPPDLGQPKNRRASPLPNQPTNIFGWSADDLAAREYRVGIARDTATRLAQDGQLYASVRRGLQKDVEMFVEAEGLEWPDGFNVAVQLGGEGRFAFASKGTSLIPAGQTVVKESYLVYFATPVVMSPPIPGEAVVGLSGKLVMASITGVASHSGRVKDHRSESNKVLPAGSVLFMDRDGDQSPLPDRIGDKTHMGYGRCYIGEWT